jgi:hypothetical protein
MSAKTPNKQTPNEQTHIELKKFITIYLSDPNPELKDLTKSQLHLTKFRNTLVDNFNLQKSRVLHMSVILYRFKQELEVGELFWKTVRTMILAVLTNSDKKELSIVEYFKHFELWKNDDVNKLIFETASIYYNILEIKKTLIAESQAQAQSQSPAPAPAPAQDITNEEIAHIDNTLNLIKTKSMKINIFDKVLEVVDEMINAKTELIKSIVVKAYWDKIEEDIENKQYQIVLDNIDELKKQMKSILPKSQLNKPNYILDECMDVQYFKQLFTHNVFDESNVIGILNIIIVFLKEWDSMEYIKLHDEKHLNIIKLIESKSLSKSLRIVLEYCTEMVNDFILRKELWTKILNL